MPEFISTIQPAYEQLRSIYIEAAALRRLASNRATVLILGDDKFAAEGGLATNGVLSGMAKLYKQLGLKSGSEIRYDIISQGQDAKIIVDPASVPAAPTLTSPPTEPLVFERQNLRRIHLEVFRPSNLDVWEPENETDIYMAFGVLQQFTDFEYCCAASKALLDRLCYVAETKPDAILIDRSTDEYLMAEWKKTSSAFKLNHKPEDVDVLVCWFDDESDRKSLPTRVVNLHSVARTAVETALSSVTAV